MIHLNSNKTYVNSIYVISISDTNNVEGVDICSLADEMYQTSCRYMSGVIGTGCSYQLTGTNSTIINIELIGVHQTSDINCCYNNIIVRNNDGYVVMSGTFSTSSLMPCQATTITGQSLMLVWL